MIDTEDKDWLVALLPHIVSLAREAGKTILSFYNQVTPQVEYKRDNSPLTQADLASHQVILNGLAKLSPGWPVIAEESPEAPFERRERWRYVWMVDSLDGTKEFLARNGEFSVNIALIECNAPILGVIHAPATCKTYFAAWRAGAYRVDGESNTPIHVTRERSGARRAVVSRSHGPHHESMRCLPSGERECDCIPMGSSLKFCLVAEGAADYYPRISPSMEWDTAAGHCILSEAGGSMTDLDGNPMTYNKPTLLNPGFLARGAN
jgi:3'(2'), 5'-bisphosphate nucleotidase